MNSRNVVYWMGAVGIIGGVYSGHIAFGIILAACLVADVVCESKVREPLAVNKAVREEREKFKTKE